MDDERPGTAGSAEAVLERYYEALRAGDPLDRFFAPTDDVVKFGVSERLEGGEAVRAGLREQTASTANWAVESRALRVTDRGEYAWFSDRVGLGWTDRERGIRYEFDTRWSGTLERRDADGDPHPDGEWRFVGMHVSTAEEW